MEKCKIGIIGGTGVYQLPGVEQLEKVKVETEYGDVTVNTGTLAGKRVAFLTRHGEKHSIAPSQINFRANIRAMQMLGVKQIFATACSGSMNPDYPSGTFVMMDQFLDFTKNRQASFFYTDGTNDRPIAHVDVTNPYCSRLNDVVVRAGREIGVEVKTGATYCCQEGPRYETAAEIRMFRQLGGDLVAHTQYPEVVLAREAEICYSAIGMVANMAAGIEDEHVSSVDLAKIMEGMFGTAQNLLAEAVRLVDEDEDCWCKHALDEAYLH